MDERRGDLLALLMPISRELRRVEEAAAARHGLSMWQYAILSVAEHGAGSNQATIATALGYSKNLMVGDLDHLERRGLVTREPAADRRANVVTVTAPGRRVRRAIQTEIHRHEDELMVGIAAGTRRMFVAALRALDEQVRLRR